MDASRELLAGLAREMDEEYARLVEWQARRRTLGGRVRDRAVSQVDGRMDVLARWGCRLRIEARRGEST